MSILSIVGKWSLNIAPHPEITLCKKSNLSPISRCRINLSLMLVEEVMTMHSLQQSQLDIEMEEWKIKIFPTDSIIWLYIWSYFKGSFPGNSLYKF